MLIKSPVQKAQHINWYLTNRRKKAIKKLK